MSTIRGHNRSQHFSSNSNPFHFLGLCGSLHHNSYVYFGALQNNCLLDDAFWSQLSQLKLFRFQGCLKAITYSISPHDFEIDLLIFQILPNSFKISSFEGVHDFFGLYLMAVVVSFETIARLFVIVQLVLHKCSLCFQQRTAASDCYFQLVRFKFLVHNFLHLVRYGIYHLWSRLQTVHHDLPYLLVLSLQLFHLCLQFIYLHV